MTETSQSKLSEEIHEKPREDMKPGIETHTRQIRANTHIKSIWPQVKIPDETQTSQNQNKRVAVKSNTVDSQEAERKYLSAGNETDDFLKRNFFSNFTHLK